MSTYISAAPPTNKSRRLRRHIWLGLAAFVLASMPASAYDYSTCLTSIPSGCTPQATIYAVATVNAPLPTNTITLTVEVDTDTPNCATKPCFQGGWIQMRLEKQGAPLTHYDSAKTCLVHMPPGPQTQFVCPVFTGVAKGAYYVRALTPEYHWLPNETISPCTSAPCSLIELARLKHQKGHGKRVVLRVDVREPWWKKIFR